MNSLDKQLRQRSWGLVIARMIADEVITGKVAAWALVRELFGEDVEVRRRAADVARRITDRSGSLLAPYADELAGLLESLSTQESRTRWHLGLVVPRVAQTHAQRLRAARAMFILANDASNVVRCSAVEGISLLARHEPSLRHEAEEMTTAFLRMGTPAMKCRARHVEKKLTKMLSL